MLIALGCILLGVAFLVPGHYVPWTSFEPQWAAGVGAAFIAAGAQMREYAPPNRHYRIPALAVGALALAMVPLLQWATGWVPFRSDAVLAATYLAAFAAMVVVGCHLATSPRFRFLAWLQGSLLLGAVASAIVAVLQWLAIDLPTIYILPLGRGDRPFGNLAQPNHLAALLCLGLAAAAFLYETRRLGGVAASACFALLAWALVLTESRAGWMMFALLSVWCLTQQRRAQLRVRAPAALLAVGLFVIAVATLPLISDALLLSQSPGAGPRLHAGSRVIHWITLWDAAIRQAWLGYGWGQVSEAQVAAALDHPASYEWIQNSHNLFLDLVIHNGVPIGLIVTVLLTVWFVRRVRACRTGAQWALLSGVGMVFAHAMVEFPLDYTYFLLPVALMMGTLHGLEKEPESEQRATWHAPRAGVAVGTLALCGMLAWIGIEYMKVDSAARQLRFVLLGVGVDRIPDAPEPDVWLLDQPRQYHRFLLTRAREGMSQEELEFMRRNATRAARPTSMLRVALAMGLNGRPRESAEWLVRICKMHSVARCDEGRTSWAAAQVQYPVLQSIAFPTAPAEAPTTAH